MRISPEVEIVPSVAASDAARRRHEYVNARTSPFCAHSRRDDVERPAPSWRRSETLKRRLDKYLSDRMETLPEDTHATPTASLGVQRVMRRAVNHVRSSGKDEVDGASVLVAIFSERDSFAVTAMEEQGISRLDVISFIAHGVSKGDGGSSTSSDEARVLQAPRQKESHRRAIR